MGSDLGEELEGLAVIVAVGAEFEGVVEGLLEVRAFLVDLSEFSQSGGGI